MHKILVTIMSYLSLIDIVKKVSRINMKMYVIAGDAEVLNKY